MTHCPTCSGLGIVWDAGDMMVCPTCDGEGVLNEAPMLLYWRDLVRVMAAVSTIFVAVYAALWWATR